MSSGQKLKENEMSDQKPLIERFCTCGKISWDSDFGSYNERHDEKGKSVPCNTLGDEYVNGVKR